jgi:hypothetical protein
MGLYFNPPEASVVRFPALGIDIEPGETKEVPDTVTQRFVNTTGRPVNGPIPFEDKVLAPGESVDVEVAISIPPQLVLRQPKAAAPKTDEKATAPQAVATDKPAPAADAKPEGK